MTHVMAPSSSISEQQDVLRLWKWDPNFDYYEDQYFMYDLPKTLKI